MFEYIEYLKCVYGFLINIFFSILSLNIKSFRI